jgi:hypothetical protein
MRSAERILGCKKKMDVVVWYKGVYTVYMFSIVGIFFYFFASKRLWMMSKRQICIFFFCEGVSLKK